VILTGRHDFALRLADAPSSFGRMEGKSLTHDAFIEEPPSQKLGKEYGWECMR